MQATLVIGWIFGGIWFISQYPLTDTLGLLGTFLFLVIWLVCIPLWMHRFFKETTPTIRL